MILLKIKGEVIMKNCGNCRFNVNGYCTYYDKYVKSTNKECPEYEEA